MNLIPEMFTHLQIINSPCTFRLQLAVSDIFADICKRTAAAVSDREFSPYPSWHASAAHSIVITSVIFVLIYFLVLVWFQFY